MGDRDFSNRRHFFGAAAEAMRRILIEQARRNARIKHGGERVRVELPEIEAPSNNTDLLDSKQVLARFDAERQAMALMDHPNIAKVFDGGLTDADRPFFAMEYVKGMPLTEYCDTAKLSVEDRLKLFIPVCQAVQHAHQKGIIHRDLKPSNILICLYDGKPVPKVIDFGLAQLPQQDF